MSRWRPTGIGPVVRHPDGTVSLRVPSEWRTTLAALVASARERESRDAITFIEPGHDVSLDAALIDVTLAESLRTQRLEDLAGLERAIGGERLDSAAAHAVLRGLAGVKRTLVDTIPVGFPEQLGADAVPMTLERLVAELLTIGLLEALADPSVPGIEEA